MTRGLWCTGLGHLKVPGSCTWKLQFHVTGKQFMFISFLRDLVQERKPARSYFLKMLCLFSTKLWLSGNSCDGQPLQRADEESVIPPFQVQPDVGPPLLCCWAPEAEGSHLLVKYRSSQLPWEERLVRFWDVISMKRGAETLFPEQRRGMFGEGEIYPDSQKKF